ELVVRQGAVQPLPGPPGGSARDDLLGLGVSVAEDPVAVLVPGLGLPQPALVGAALGELGLVQLPEALAPVGGLQLPVVEPLAGFQPAGVGDLVGLGDLTPLVDPGPPGGVDRDLTAVLGVAERGVAVLVDLGVPPQAVGTVADEHELLVVPLTRCLRRGHAKTVPRSWDLIDPQL